MLCVSRERSDHWAGTSALGQLRGKFWPDGNRKSGYGGLEVAVTAGGTDVKW